MQRERSLLYVAASRARDELVVTWSGRRSELLGWSGCTIGAISAVDSSAFCVFMLIDCVCRRRRRAIAGA